MEREIFLVMQWEMGSWEIGSREVFPGVWLKLEQGKHTQTEDLGKSELEGPQKVLFSLQEM